MFFLLLSFPLGENLLKPAFSALHYSCEIVIFYVTNVFPPNPNKQKKNSESEIIQISNPEFSKFIFYSPTFSWCLEFC